MITSSRKLAWPVYTMLFGSSLPHTPCREPVLPRTAGLTAHAHLIAPTAPGGGTRKAQALVLAPCAPTLTFRDTVLSGQEALLEEALQHGAHGGPVDQLQHEEMGLPGEKGHSVPAPRPPRPAPLVPRGPERPSTGKNP